MQNGSGLGQADIEAARVGVSAGATNRTHVIMIPSRA
jgi:hypothetical protein